MINLLMVFYPIIRDIFKYFLNKMNIEADNKRKLFAAIEAVDYERSMPQQLRRDAQEQIEALSKENASGNDQNSQGTP